MAGEAEVIRSGDAAAFPTTAGELKLIEQAVHLLPADAVRELFSLGVCVCCIFRLFGIYDLISSRPSLSASTLAGFVKKVIGLEKDDDCDASTKSEVMCGQKSSNELDLVSEVCKICVGILNFVYHDEKGILIKKDSANEFAAVIAEAVKREHGHIDSFSLEVSLPSLLTENEQAVWLYIREKYASQLGSAGNSLSGNLSTKDALKLSIVDPLEKLLGVKSKTSSFHIRFTYSSFKESARPEVINGCKRRKTGKVDAISTRYASESCGTERSKYQACEKQESIKTSTDQSEGHGIHLLNDQLEKVNQPYHLIFLCYRSPVYIGGRYLKYSRNVSQTRWVIDDERMGEASVEEIIGGNILPLCQGDSYKFHAAGREDIDVRMLGTGRPFLVEIQNARQVPSGELINQIEMKINNLENKLVGVKNLKVLGSKGWELMREGETEKQKQYTALVWLSRPLNNDDLQTLSSLKEMEILQKTPVRVLHRRSPLEREKIIHWMKVERIAGSSQYFLLHLCTQAGTYIKEFVHGDLGRTNPRCRSSSKFLSIKLKVCSLTHWWGAFYPAAPRDEWAVAALNVLVPFLGAEQKYCNLTLQMSKWIASNSKKLLSPTNPGPCNLNLLYKQ